MFIEDEEEYDLIGFIRNYDLEKGHHHHHQSKSSKEIVFKAFRMHQQRGTKYFIVVTRERDVETNKTKDYIK